MKASFDIHYGDYIGGIYQSSDGRWYLHEVPVTKIVENSKGCFVHSRGFRPLYKSDIEDNTYLASGDNGMIFRDDVCLLTDEIRDRFIKWVNWANNHPDVEKSAIKAQQHSEGRQLNV